MKCPYINPTIQQCEKCYLPDCVRDERQDDREKCKRYYYKDIDKSRQYHRERARARYDRQKNTEMCRKYRLANIEKKRQYDRERYLRKKAEAVS